MPTLNPEEEEDLNDPYRVRSAGEGSRGFPSRPGLQQTVGRRYRSGRELAASTRRYIGRVAERQLQRDQARDQREFAADAINERAGREVVGRRSSQADIDKAIDAADGTGLKAQTPGIDAYKRTNRFAGGSSVRPDQMRHAVSQVADEIKANQPKPRPRPSIVVTPPKSGPSITVKPPVVGKVRDEKGNMVPIAEETARLAAERKPALDAADRAATETAAAYNRNLESNPAVALAQKVDAYQTSQRMSPASPSAPGSVVAQTTQTAEDRDPFRRKLVAGR